jgi:hypothetical protein
MTADGDGAWRCHCPRLYIQGFDIIFNHNFIIPPISTIKDAGTLTKRCAPFNYRTCFFYMSCMDLYRDMHVHMFIVWTYIGTCMFTCLLYGPTSGHACSHVYCMDLHRDMHVHMFIVWTFIGTRMFTCLLYGPLSGHACSHIYCMDLYRDMHVHMFIVWTFIGTCIVWTFIGQCMFTCYVCCVFF